MSIEFVYFVCLFVVCLLTTLVGHEEKCNVLAFHPHASSLLVTAGYDRNVLIWDLEEKEVAITLDPLPEPVSLLCI